MLDKFFAYTNLLIKYNKETNDLKKLEYEYQLMLLDANFKPVFNNDKE